MHKNAKCILTTAVSWRMICPRDKTNLKGESAMMINKTVPTDYG